MPSLDDDRPPSPKSVVLDILSALDERSVPVSTLVSVGELLGISSNRLRVALSRLRATGTVVSVQRGEYALGSRAQRRNRQVVSWADVEATRVAWDGTWVGVLSGEDEPALSFLGFRLLRDAFHVRPNNLRGGVEALRVQLEELGLGEDAMVFRVDALPAVDEGRARKLWPINGQAAAHRAMAARLQRSLERCRGRDDQAVLRELFLLGGRAIRAIVLDPRLPEEIADPDPLRELVDAMREYDFHGRRLWRAFLDLPKDGSMSDAPAHGSSLRARMPGGAVEA